MNDDSSCPQEMLDEGCVSVLGARVHNLKNIDVDIPHYRLTVITGLSGSGKSSLAFDTIFAEGQRRYLETFSSYARNMLGVLERPDVDAVTLSGGGIFVVVTLGIEHLAWLHAALSFVEEHRVHGHALLVPTEQRQCVAVGAPAQRTEHVEFLLRHPVGHAVTQFPLLPVVGHLQGDVAVDAAHKQIVVLHIGNALSVGR